jgi:SAM-dependent MidA family methyltransferase
MLVGRQIHELWQAMGSPPGFQVVEQGAGRGILARDITRWAVDAAPGFAAAMQYTIVEPRPRLRDAQRETLVEIEEDVALAWSDGLPAGIVGCVLTNELLDAFPVHRVKRAGDALREIYVTHDGTAFADQLGEVSDPLIEAYFHDLSLLPGEGCYAEVNLEAPQWLARVAAHLRNGYVMTFDYGYDAPDLYAPWRRDGTLLCFYAQSASSDPYQRIGRQDITASVDFTTLRTAARRAGLLLAGESDQSRFLLRLGIGDAVAAAADRAQMEEYFARRHAALDLIDPARLGRIKVLLHAKDAPAHHFTGFGDA